jgi:acyl carrier protein
MLNKPVLSRDGRYAMSDRAAPDQKIGDLAREFAPALPEDPARARDASLQDAGLTSMATVKLMLAIEAAYDVAIPDAELTPENFSSIAAIEALLARLEAA